MRYTESFLQITANGKQPVGRPDNAERRPQLHRQRGFRIRMNGDPKYPQMIQVLEEVSLPKARRKKAVKGGRHQVKILTRAKEIIKLRKMETTREQISHEKGNNEAWICICGNTPGSDGFYPCNEEGHEVEPDAEWHDLYVCAKCGRIINQHSLVVTGRTRK